ncbi:hypothetical protein [Nocardia terpenica]|uniref:hypothetical protein n=1 Tax=Nocardia terpenica TaxID=455432 RepID=UPI0012FD8FED|nr:hypothetical protein [Nocardia terpenica]
MSPTGRTLPRWLRTLCRVVVSLVVLAAVPGVAIAFALSAHRASVASATRPTTLSALDRMGTGTASCPAPSVWTGSTNGRGIRVKLHNMAAAPQTITVTVVHDADRITKRTKTIQPGQNDLEVDFHKLHENDVDAVFMQTSQADRCEVDSLGDVLGGTADR